MRVACKLNRRNPWTAIQPFGKAALAFALWLVPSVGQLTKYLDPWEAATAVALAALAFGLIFVRVERSQGAPDWPPWAPALVALLIALAFAGLFPVARSGLLGRGSDRADALDVAISALLAGRPPYDALTYLGNTPTPLPGALILAMPFHLIGASALQNLLWAPLFAIVSPAIVGERRGATVLVAGLILLSPGAMQDFVTGGDYLVNALYVALALHWAGRTSQQSQIVPNLASGVGLALAVSSRAIYAVEAPVILALVIQARGLRGGVLWAVWFGLCLAMINGPVFLANPSGFPLFMSESKIRYFPRWIQAGLWLPAISVLIAFAAFFQRLTPDRVFGVSALALAPMLLPILLWRLATEGPTSTVLMSASYSLPITIFGGLWLFRRTANAPADNGHEVPSSAGPTQAKQQSWPGRV